MWDRIWTFLKSQEAPIWMIRTCQVHIMQDHVHWRCTFWCNRMVCRRKERKEKKKHGTFVIQLLTNLMATAPALHVCSPCSILKHLLLLTNQYSSQVIFKRHFCYLRCLGEPKECIQSMKHWNVWMFLSLFQMTITNLIIHINRISTLISHWFNRIKLQHWLDAYKA